MGQCVLNLWYYKFRRPTGAPAREFFNNNHFWGYPKVNPEFWVAHTQAARIASRLQFSKGQISSWTDSLILPTLHSKLPQNYETSPDATYPALIAQMKASKQPVLINIYHKEQLSDGTTQIIGHALICYKAVGGLVYVDDPNEPFAKPDSNAIETDFHTLKLKPYASAINASANRERFEKLILVPDQYWLSNEAIEQIFKEDTTSRAKPGMFGSDSDGFENCFLYQSAPHVTRYLCDTPSAAPERKGSDLSSILNISGITFDEQLEVGEVYGHYSALVYKTFESVVPLPEIDTKKPYTDTIVDLKTGFNVLGVALMKTTIDEKDKPHFKTSDFRWINILRLPRIWTCTDQVVSLNYQEFAQKWKGFVHVKEGALGGWCICNEDEDVLVEAFDLPQQKELPISCTSRGMDFSAGLKITLVDPKKIIIDFGLDSNGIPIGTITMQG